MKYFLDTEFNEGFKKPFKWLPRIGNFNKAYHFIELISIGIVAEDGRTYYAISKDLDVSAAYNKYDVIPFLTAKNHSTNDIREYWLRDNVLKPIFYSFYKPSLTNIHHVYDMSLSRMKSVFRNQGKSRKKIAEEIFNFVNPDLGFHVSAYNNSELKAGGRLDTHFGSHNVEMFGEHFLAQPEFYAYYGDYDWVVFCSLFGKMIDLPKGFPIYCRDLKQTLDEKALSYDDRYMDGKENLSTRLSYLKGKDSYPKQKNEHNALEDAKWNYELYKFLKQL